MPGFSKNDQARLAALLLGHTGKLGKLANYLGFNDWRMLFCLRLAHVLSRGRSDLSQPQVKVSESKESFIVEISKDWAKSHPLTEFSLQKEAAEWERVGRSVRIILK